MTKNEKRILVIGTIIDSKVEPVFPLTTTLHNQWRMEISLMISMNEYLDFLDKVIQLASEYSLIHPRKRAKLEEMILLAKKEMK